MKIQVKLLNKDSKVPIYSTVGAAGCDFYASEDFTLPATTVTASLEEYVKEELVNDATRLFVEDKPDPAYQAQLFLDIIEKAITQATYKYNQGRLSVKSGVAFGIPKNSNIELELRGRSGLAFNHSITLVQGTVDEDFELEVSILLVNNTSEPMHFTKGQRIAQGVFKKIIQADFEVVNEINPVVLDSSERESNSSVQQVQREGGKGSTGL